MRKTPMISLAALAVAGLLTGAGPAPVQPDAADPMAWVDPYIGVDWYGQSFLGATRPFGMVKLGPDMESFDGRPSKFGYLSGGRVLGYSHLHLQGAAGKYGNIRLMPAAGAFDLADVTSPANDETATPDYYAATLTRPDVRVELTTTERAGLHRYTFRSGDDAHLTVRLDRILTQSNGREGQKFLGADLTVDSAREISGMGRYAGGWNLGGEYRVYFVILLDQDAAEVRTWGADGFSEGSTMNVEGDHPIGASFDFGGRAGQVVNAKVGISFVSVEQARRNAQAAPDFDTARAEAHTAWEQALSPIQVEGGSPAERRQFYTALYHLQLMPSDRTGENPGWTSAEPYYDDYQAVWDTFRSAWPLLTLIQPERSRDLLRSLIDVYRHEGWMPDARVGNSNGRTQGGSNSDVVVADAFVKGMTGIDYSTAFEAMVKNATVNPPDAEKEGRGGLPDYLTRGYISTSYDRAGSRTVEYAYNDFAIAQVACGLGQPDVAARYRAQSGNFANLFDRDMEVQGITGFIRPRNPDGTWAEPYMAKRGTWPDFFYEADLWTYSLYAPHDVAQLIELSGGREAFTRRVDALFDRLQFDMTNEPGFLLPMLYHYVGRPDKSVQRIIDYRGKGFLDARGGTPGPEDSGAMSSWYAFHAMGFFPVAGQDLYLIGSPIFTRSALNLGQGRSLTIEAPGAADPANRYVQSAELNGRPIDRAWFRHSEIASGGRLVLHMGPAPTAWGTTELPPSLSGNDAASAALRCPAA